MALLIPDTKFEGGPNMLQRFALVLWWCSAVITSLAAIGFIASMWVKHDGYFLVVVSAFFGVGSWIIGRAAFFILAGR